MRCVIFGATGYLGTRLVPELLSTGHQVRVMARNPAKLEDVPWRDRVEVVEGDVTVGTQVQRALEGQEVLYYLVHSLLRPDFVGFDARGASTVAGAARSAGLSRIVYVGGLISGEQKLSDHLASRAEVGRLLRESGVPTVELRAAAIIGAGSASFEILRYLTERLPLMVTPRWLRTRVQPIAVRDVLYYLTETAKLPRSVDRAFDIGGPDTFTYTEMIRQYAAIAGLRRRIMVPVPVLTPWLSSHWVSLITPVPRPLAVSLMESLKNDVVCADHDIAGHIPDPKGGLVPYGDAVELALACTRVARLRTRWSRPDAEGSPSRPLPTDPSWAGGSLHEHICQRLVPVDLGALWNVIESIAAEHNRFAGLPLRRRGHIERAARIGGSRRHPHWPHSGQKLGWWRVELIDRSRLLLLRASIPLPGRLWLELSVHSEAGGSVYRQRALFQPYGLAGEAFWAAYAPLRDLVLRAIARRITSSAKQASGSGRVASTLAGTKNIAHHTDVKH
jgi:uncharacterized protein YbjT (DUF2867 family)